MRTIQLLGLVVAISAIALGYLLLSPIETDSSASAAGAVGLGLIFLICPAAVLSALLLVPSSIALLWPEIRKRSYFIGPFWKTLWVVNGVLSLGYLFIALYLGYIWFVASTGGSVGPVI